jgi:pectin methylesterase-like acyl-CoA thioesterase
VGQTYTTIQAAINAATAGDNIIVHTGTYNELIIWNKAVNIIENTSDTAVLQLSAPNTDSLSTGRPTAQPSGTASTW